MKWGGNMQFHEKLRALRKGKGWTQQELADNSGVSYRMVQKYENNIAFPRVTAAEKLAECLGVTIDELMCRQEIEIANLEEEKYEDFQKYALKNINNIAIAMAGGKFKEEDRELIFQSIMEAYVEAKQKGTIKDNE